MVWGLGVRVVGVWGLRSRAFPKMCMYYVRVRMKGASKVPPF